MVGVGIEVALLPLVVQLDVWPHPPHHGRVGVIAEVPHEFVDVVEVHVVVAHLVGAPRQAADVAVRVDRRAPLLEGACKVAVRILLRLGIDWRDIRDHAPGVLDEV